MNRLVPLIKRLEAELGKIPDELAEPEFARCAKDKAVIEFYVRMLFSCLVMRIFWIRNNLTSAGNDARSSWTPRCCWNDCKRTGASFNKNQIFETSEL